MIVSANSVDVPSGKVSSDELSQMAMTAMVLLQSGDCEAFAERYGYALAFDRETALALRADFNQTLSEANLDAAVFNSLKPLIEIQRFEENDSNIHAAVVCKVAAESGPVVLVEFIVSGEGPSRHFKLEQISSVL